MPFFEANNCQHNGFNSVSIFCYFVVVIGINLIIFNFLLSTQQSSTFYCLLIRYLEIQNNQQNKQAIDKNDIKDKIQEVNINLLKQYYKLKNHYQQYKMPKRQQSSSSSEDQSSQSQPIKYVSVNISKLTPNVTEQHLHQIFSHFATVKSVFLNKGLKLTSTATIQFQKKQEAQLAIKYMNKGFIDGSKIIVEHTQQQQQAKIDKIGVAEVTTKIKKIEKPQKPSRRNHQRGKRNHERQSNRYRERSRSREVEKKKQKKNKYNQKRSSSSSSSPVSSSRSSDKMVSKS